MVQTKMTQIIRGTSNRSLIYLTIFLIVCSCERKIKRIEKSWLQLRTNTDRDHERRIVDEMRLLLQGNSFSLYYIDVDGNRANVQSNNDCHVKFTEIHIKIQNNREEEWLTGWHPRDDSNVYAFYFE